MWQNKRLSSEKVVYNHWTGLVDWTGGLDWWTGLLNSSFFPLFTKYLDNLCRYYTEYDSFMYTL